MEYYSATGGVEEGTAAGLDHARSRQLVGDVDREVHRCSGGLYISAALLFSLCWELCCIICNKFPVGMETLLVAVDSRLVDPFLELLATHTGTRASTHVPEIIMFFFKKKRGRETFLSEKTPHRSCSGNLILWWVG